jgi:hypothetical protein
MVYYMTLIDLVFGGAVFSFIVSAKDFLKCLVPIPADRAAHRRARIVSVPTSR